MTLTEEGDFVVPSRRTRHEVRGGVDVRSFMHCVSV